MMAPKKQCDTCRHYQRAPIRGQGWCRNPQLHLPQERHLVDGKDLACDRLFSDTWWEPVPPPEPDNPQSRWSARWQFVVAVVVVLMVAGTTLGPSLLAERTEAQPTPVPTAVPVTVAALTATPSSAPSPSPTLPPKVRVGNTDGDGAYIRVEPKTGAKGIVAWPDGTELEVQGRATETDGREWLNVQDGQGHTGWIPQEYTVAGEEKGQ